MTAATPLCRCSHRVARHDHGRTCSLCECPAYRPARREPRFVETAEYHGFARRVIASYANRVADADIEGLAGLAALQTDIDAAIRVAVANLHAGGYSWTDIGRVLGVTRQAARQRFAPGIE